MVTLIQCIVSFGNFLKCIEIKTEARLPNLFHTYIFMFLVLGLEMNSSHYYLHLRVGGLKV